MTIQGQGISRREFARGVVSGAALLGAGALLGACGSSPHTSTAVDEPRSGPKRGGTLRVGLTGGTSADTVNPLFELSNLDFARCYALYDCLVTFDRSGNTALALAEEITPNADASVWTIRLRKGVEFHNGKTLHAEDVVYTFQQMLNPKALGSGAAALATLDVKHMKVVDPLTVSLPFTKPLSALPAVLATYYYLVIPVGFDPKAPVGTGPYKYKSFTPGVESVFTRNDRYWQAGLPYTDELVLTDVPDETTAVNALMANNLDCAEIASPTLIPQLKSANVEVVISEGGSFVPFVMNTSVPPFTDPKVRAAFRLAVDRVDLRNVVYGGHGLLGNDVFGIWDPVFDTAIPQRHQDIAQAKSLLKAAGHEDLSIQLTTAPILPGAVEQAQVFAEQAAAAGIHVTLNQVTSTELYGPKYLKWQFSQDYLYYSPYFATVLALTLPNSELPETHFDDPEYVRLFESAQASTSFDRQRTLAHEMQRIDYDLGGYIIACFPPTLDAHRSSIGGVQPSRIGVPFNNYDFKSLWVES